MILGYHIIFTAYGFWLPNDPRGSWSEFVASWDLYRFGDATKTDSRKSVAANPHNRELREQAKEILKYPPVTFDNLQIQIIGEGIAESTRKGQLDIWACAIMPDHVHMVVGRHRCSAEQIMNQTKGQISKKLIASEMHPFQDIDGGRTSVPSCWAAKGWIVFLDSNEDIIRSIGYVIANPRKENRPEQTWDFVKPFDPV